MAALRGRKLYEGKWKILFETDHPGRLIQRFKDAPTFAGAPAARKLPRRGAMKIVANGVNALRSPDRAMLVVTHYQRLLNYIVPDFVHVLVDGRIVRSGGKELALELEAQGYAGIEGEGAQLAKV